MIPSLFLSVFLTKVQYSDSDDLCPFFPKHLVLIRCLKVINKKKLLGSRFDLSTHELHPNFSPDVSPRELKSLHEIRCQKIRQWWQ